MTLAGFDDPRKDPDKNHDQLGQSNGDHSDHDNNKHGEDTRHDQSKISQFRPSDQSHGIVENDASVQVPTSRMRRRMPLRRSDRFTKEKNQDDVMRMRRFYDYEVKHIDAIIDCTNVLMELVSEGRELLEPDPCESLQTVSIFVVGRRTPLTVLTREDVGIPSQSYTPNPEETPDRQYEELRKGLLKLYAAKNDAERKRDASLASLQQVVKQTRGVMESILQDSSVKQHELKLKENGEHKTALKNHLREIRRDEQESICKYGNFIQKVRRGVNSNTGKHGWEGVVVICSKAFHLGG